MTISISEGARNLYNFLPSRCWMTERNLANALGCRVTKIKAFKEELEAAGLIEIHFHRKGRRSNPCHEVIKLSKSGSPINKRLGGMYCLETWGEFPREAQVECYVNSGWDVVPFAPKAKKPIREFSAVEWKKLTGEQKINFFYNNRNCNVGFVVRPDMMVVDVDSKNNLWLEHKSFQTTLSVSTARGTHFYFRNDPVVVTSTKVLPDIDTKCVGSYVLLPPSIHPSGDVYKWENTVLPDQLPVAFRRAWRQSYFESSAPNGGFTLPETIFEGARNDTLWRYGRSLKSRGKTFHEIDQQISRVNWSKCSPPLPGLEITKLIERIWSAPNRRDFRE